MVIPHLVRNRLPAMDERQTPDVPLPQTTLQTKLNDQKYYKYPVQTSLNKLTHCYLENQSDRQRRITKNLKQFRLPKLQRGP